MKEINLNPIIARVMDGDNDAFQELYCVTKDDAYRLIVYLASNKQDASDIMSEVYLELYRVIRRYDQNQSFSSWLNGIIIRQVRNWKRKGWRRLRLHDRVKQYCMEDAHNDLDNHLYNLYAKELVLPAVEQLSHKLKEVIVLRYARDCSIEEIAMILNIPVGTVKSRHHLALKQLRSHMDKQAGKKGATTYVH